MSCGMMVRACLSAYLHDSLSKVQVFFSPGGSCYPLLSHSTRLIESQSSDSPISLILSFLSPDTTKGLRSLYFDGFDT